MNRSYLTAISRKGPSLPTRKLIKEGLIFGRVLDYGCGRGRDCKFLNCEGYDPYYRPKRPIGKYDTIICHYVLNVISPIEQLIVLNDLDELLEDSGVAYITVRRDVPKKGWGLSSKGTLQRKVELELPIVLETKAFVTYKLTRGGAAV